MLHELIDREEPRCLYCHSDMDLKVDGVGTASPTYEVEILTCRTCSEIFEMFSQTYYDETTYTGFLFSCLDIYSLVMYTDNTILLGDQDLRWPVTTHKQSSKIPIFNIDFSNKDKLYRKLKSYLLIS